MTANDHLSLNDDVVFSVTVEELQQEAMRRVGRKLTAGELRVAAKGVESGLSFGFETVLKTAIQEAVSQRKAV